MSTLRHIFTYIWIVFSLLLHTFVSIAAINNPVITDVDVADIVREVHLEVMDFAADNPIHITESQPTQLETPTRKLEVGGSSLPLTDLGPMIINPDGSARRITNWSVLSEAEKQVAWSRIKARNQRRVKRLQVSGASNTVLEEKDELNTGKPIAFLPGLDGDDGTLAPPVSEELEERRRSMY